MSDDITQPARWDGKAWVDLGPHIVKSWQSEFDDRELSHIRFCEAYAENYKHEPSGHLDMIIIAKLVGLVRHLTNLAMSSRRVIFVMRGGDGEWRDINTGVKVDMP